MYISQRYEETINEIKMHCENQKLSVSIDETTCVDGHNECYSWLLTVELIFLFLIKFKDNFWSFFVHY